MRKVLIGAGVILALTGCSVEVNKRPPTTTTTPSYTSGVTPEDVWREDTPEHRARFCDLLQSSRKVGLSDDEMEQAFAKGYGSDPRFPSAQAIFDEYRRRCDGPVS